MALITCPECGKEVSDRAASCIHCGCPLSSKETYEVAFIGQIPKIERKIFAARIHEYFPKSIPAEKAASIAESANAVIISGIDFDTADLFRQLMQETYPRIVVRKSGQESNIEAVTRCPRCGSKSIGYHRRGFSVGKAAIGALISAPVGLVAGALGSSSEVRICRSCGHKF